MIFFQKMYVDRVRFKKSTEVRYAGMVRLKVQGT